MSLCKLSNVVLIKTDHQPVGHVGKDSTRIKLIFVPSFPTKTGKDLANFVVNVKFPQGRQPRPRPADGIILLKEI